MARLDTIRSLALGAALTLFGLSSCQPTGHVPEGNTLRSRTPEAQDVDAEWEPPVPGAVELCDSPRVFIPFDKSIEQQVYQVISAYQTGLDETMERLTAKVVVEESAKYNLDPWLVVGVMRVESRFYNFAESNRGARGLMQLRPFVAEDLASTLGVRWTGPDTLYNPVKNVKLGVAYLAILDHRFGGNLDKTLAAYNMGPNRVRDWMRAGRDLPTGYASLVGDYTLMLASASRNADPGADLRGPITAIEHRMARKSSVVILPVVADVDPADNGIAESAALPGLLAPPSEPDPAFNADEDTAPKASFAESLSRDSAPAPEPEIRTADDELDAILK